MDTWWAWVLVVFGAVVAVVVLNVYLGVTKLAAPDLALSPAPESAYPGPYVVVGEHERWADEQGFDWVGGYLFSGLVPIFVAAWQHAGHPTYFCIYIPLQATAGRFYDVVTIFDEAAGIALTTSSSKDGLLFPPAPGAYQQGFPHRSPEELWEAHLEAEVFLEETRGIKAKPMERPFEKALVDAIHRQMKHIRSIFLWPVRGVWWYFVRRNRMADKTVEQQLGSS